MARKLAGDEQALFRARIEWRKGRDNPDYNWDDDSNPRYLPDPDAPVQGQIFGPYGTPGAARGQLTNERNYRERYGYTVLSGKIQRAAIEWSDVE